MEATVARSCQVPNEVVMIRPDHFGYDPETAQTNAFQAQQQNDTVSKVAKLARSEFDNAVAALRGKGVAVKVFNDVEDRVLPDAVFPNNWFSTHPSFGGTLVLYPMLGSNRAKEKRQDIVDYIRDKFQVARVMDYSHLSGTNSGLVLEGTGSVVIDHDAKIAFACRSPRTNAELLEKLSKESYGEGYRTIVFDAAFGSNRQPIYHTNVMMWIGSKVAAVCLECISNIKERKHVGQMIKASHKELVELTIHEMENFCGNCLEVSAADSLPREKNFLAISGRAVKALRPETKARIEEHLELLIVDLPTIETVGGGGFRCMMAGIHLKK